MEANIRKTTSRRELLGLAGKASVLSLFYGGGLLVGKGVLKTDKKVVSPKAVMVVLGNKKPINKGQGQVVNSIVFPKACRKLGYEFRMYKEDADLFQEEEWVKQMHRQGVDFGCPCVVIVDAEGRGRCYAIPTSLKDALALIGDNHEV